MSQTVLILGENGRFGRHAVQAFNDAGWHVRTFDRTTDDLQKAAQGVDVIINGWNPPPSRWAATLDDLHGPVLKVAADVGASVFLPGNVYPYGSEISVVVREDDPKLPDTIYGQARQKLEKDYAQSAAQTIILRAGDFLEPYASGNWFDLVVAKKVHKGILEYPGQQDMKHAWAYLPDLARAVVALAAIRQNLPNHSDILFEGQTFTAHEMAQTLSDITGQAVQVRKMAWWPIRLMAPFWPMGRYLIAMKYLWDREHSLDGSKMRQLLPDFQPTPKEAVLTQSIRRLPLGQT